MRKLNSIKADQGKIEEIYELREQIKKQKKESEEKKVQIYEFKKIIRENDCVRNIKRKSNGSNESKEAQNSDQRRNRKIANCW